MAFRTDGSSHENGIKNEVRVANKLMSSAPDLFPNLSDDFEVELKGGTQNKADVSIIDGQIEIPISIKNKKRLKTGSYDLVNSSAGLDQFDSLSTVKSDIKNIDITTSVSTVRRKVNSILHEGLKGLKTSELRDFLREHINQKNEGFTVVISDRETQKDYKFNYDDLPLKHSIDNHTPKLKWGRGKTSCKVVFEDDQGNVHDHNIRVRVTLNNGVKALMGISKSNKASIPSIKIQQDKVHKVVESLQKINKIQTF